MRLADTDTREGTWQQNGCTLVKEKMKSCHSVPFPLIVSIFVVCFPSPATAFASSALFHYAFALLVLCYEREVMFAVGVKGCIWLWFTSLSLMHGHLCLIFNISTLGGRSLQRNNRTRSFIVKSKTGVYCMRFCSVQMFFCSQQCDVKIHIRFMFGFILESLGGHLEHPFVYAHKALIVAAV